MSYAEQELAIAQTRLLEARTDLKLFRKSTNSVDLSRAQWLKLNYWLFWKRIRLNKSVLKCSRVS